MSAESAPISPSRFAAALADLPISSLYAKHAELTNNIAHLEASNKHLEDYAREHDDRDCYEALLENRQVVKSMTERMDLVKREVQDVRGLPWRPRDEGEVRREEGALPVLPAAGAQTNGAVQESQGGAQVQGDVQAQGDVQVQGNAAAQAGDEEEGVYL